MTKDEIKELMQLFAQTNVNKIKIKEQNGFEIELEKDMRCEVVTPVEVAPQNISVSVPEALKSSVVNFNNPTINSPMVGTFYQAPSPDAKPYVKVGDVVSKGQSVAIIEAMKIMNTIEAEFDCKIVKILVEDGQPVEFNMPIFEVEKL